VFLGQQIGRTRNISSETAKLIEEEIRQLVMDGFNEARRILTDRSNDFEALGQGLLEYETLSGDEITNLLAGQAPIRDDDDGGSAPQKPRSSAVPAAGRSKPAPDSGAVDPQPA